MLRKRFRRVPDTAESGGEQGHQFSSNFRTCPHLCGRATFSESHAVSGRRIADSGPLPRLTNQKNRRPFLRRDADLLWLLLSSQFVQQFFRCVYRLLNFRTQSGVIIKETNFRKGADEAGNLSRTTD